MLRFTARQVKEEDGLLKLRNWVEAPLRAHTDPWAGVSASWYWEWVKLLLQIPENCQVILLLLRRKAPRLAGWSVAGGVLPWTRRLEAHRQQAGRSRAPLQPRRLPPVPPGGRVQHGARQQRGGLRSHSLSRKAECGRIWSQGTKTEMPQPITLAKWNSIPKGGKSCF